MGYSDVDPARDDRHYANEGQKVIREDAKQEARKHPHYRPYAHPFYWAGFQITGW